MRPKILILGAEGNPCSIATVRRLMDVEEGDRRQPMDEILKKGSLFGALEHSALEMELELGDITQDQYEESLRRLNGRQFNQVRTPPKDFRHDQARADAAEAKRQRKADKLRRQHP